MTYELQFSRVPKSHRVLLVLIIHMSENLTYRYGFICVASSGCTRKQTFGVLNRKIPVMRS